MATKSTVLKDKDGTSLYPVTDVSLVVGLQEGAIMKSVVVSQLPTADATTVGTIYMVPSATVTGEYDRYMTTYSNSAYTWTQLGSTAIPSPVIADNLTTNDATQALSAKQGKVLNDNMTQLGQKVTILDTIDSEPVAGSNNLVKSGGVFNMAVVEGIYLNSQYKIRTASNTACIVKGVKAGEKYYLYVESASMINGQRRLAFFTDYTTDTENPISTFFYSSPNTFYELIVPSNAHHLVINVHWTDNSGDPAGYHLFTADEYFLYLKEYNRASGVEAKNLSVASAQSFTTEEKERGLGNLGVSIVGNITPDGNGLVTSKGIFTMDLISGYVTSTNTFKLADNLSAHSAILRKVKPGETYHIIIDFNAITRSDSRKVLFFGDWNPVDGVVSNNVGVIGLYSPNTWYDIVVPANAKYMVIQTRFTPDGQPGIGDPAGYHLYTNDEYELNKYRLPNFVNILNGKTILWFGSSIVEGFGQYPYTSKYGWATPISERYGAICDNQGVSGSTYRDKTSLGIHCIVNDVISYISAYPSYNNIDYVIILGGLNDRDNSSKWGTVDANNFVDYPNNDMDYTTSALENLCSYLAGTERLSNTKYGVIIPYTVNDSPNNPGWEPAHWNELADRLVSVLNKWGIPHLDLRKTCGFTLCSENARKIYATDLTTFDGDYDTEAGYITDQRVKYNGIVYRAKQTIPAPAGEWDSSKWTQVSDDNGFDRTHINRFAYDKTASLVADWIMSL